MWQLVNALASGAPASAVVDVLTSQDDAAQLLQAGTTSCVVAAAGALPCMASVTIANTSYNPGTFFEEGIAFMAHELLVASTDLAAVPGVRFLGYSVFSYEAIALQLNLTVFAVPATPPPVIATSVPSSSSGAATAVVPTSSSTHGRRADSTGSPAATAAPSTPGPTATGTSAPTVTPAPATVLPTSTPTNTPTATTGPSSTPATGTLPPEWRGAWVVGRGS